MSERRILAIVGLILGLVAGVLLLVDTFQLRGNQTLTLDLVAERVVALIVSLGILFASLLAHLDLSHHLVVLTSDHGNLEDLATDRHTCNPVPAAFWGAGAASAAGRVRTIADIAPAILRCLNMLR